MHKVTQFNQNTCVFEKPDLRTFLLLIQNDTYKVYKSYQTKQKSYTIVDKNGLRLGNGK